MAASTDGRDVDPRQSRSRGRRRHGLFRPDRRQPFRSTRRPARRSGRPISATDRRVSACSSGRADLCRRAGNDRLGHRRCRHQRPLRRARRQDRQADMAVQHHPAPGEAGHETWPADNDAWKNGGAGCGSTPAVDPALGLVYFGTSNAGHPNMAARSDRATTSTRQRCWRSTSRPASSNGTSRRCTTTSGKAISARRWCSTIRCRRQAAQGNGGAADRRRAVPARPCHGQADHSGRGAAGEAGCPAEDRARPSHIPVGVDKVGPNCVEPDLIPAGFKAGLLLGPDQFRSAEPGLSDHDPVRADVLQPRDRTVLHQRHVGRALDTAR